MKPEYQTIKDQFLQDIQNGLTPSASVRAIMRAQRMNTFDRSFLYHCLESAYPDIYLVGITGRVTDANYPNLNCTMTDTEFDELIKNALQ